MKWGLIARADASGLAVQTYEVYSHLDPDKVLVIDLSEYANDREGCNKLADLSKYPGALVHKGITPPPHLIEEFLDGLDTVYTAETPYTFDLIHRGNVRNISSIVHVNPEFCDHLQNPNLTKPTLFALPTRWRFDDIPEPKAYLPVPIAVERFTLDSHPPTTATNFLHPVGTPAIHDRNGTLSLLVALRYVSAEVNVTVRCQRPGYVSALIAQHNIRTPPNVALIIESAPAENYWDLYKDQHAVLLPRRFGGLCLPCQEAIGHHLPCIMTDISPNNLWLPKDWLVSATFNTKFMARTWIDVYDVDVKALATKIDALATDLDLYARAREDAVELALEHSWTTLAPRYREVLASPLSCCRMDAEMG